MTGTATDRLRQFLATTKPFEAGGWYEPQMDQFMYVAEDVTPRADRVDPLLTLLWHPQRDEIIGLKLKGFRHFCDALIDSGKLEEGGFTTLVELIIEARLAGYLMDMKEAHEAARSEARKRKYAQAKSFAKVHMGSLRVSELAAA